jgi:hypothetical protein
MVAWVLWELGICKVFQTIAHKVLKTRRKCRELKIFHFFNQKLRHGKFSAYGKDCHVGIFTHQSVVILFA